MTSEFMLQNQRHDVTFILIEFCQAKGHHLMTIAK